MFNLRLCNAATIQYSLSKFVASSMDIFYHIVVSVLVLAVLPQLEQLEHMRSEIPPAARLPILVIHIRSQVNTKLQI